MMNDLISRQPETHEERTETHACDCISRQAVIEINRSYHGQMPNEVNHRIWKEINELPSAQPDSKELSFTQKKLDTISRQDAIDAVQKLRDAEVRQYGKVPCKGYWELTAAMNAVRCVPTAQPETHEERTETHACDCISRQAAIDAHYEYCNKHPDAGFPVWSLKILEDLPSAQPEHTNSWCINSWCIDCKEYDTENKCCPRYNRVIKQTLDDAYRHGETEAEARYHAQQRWIPCSERLPDEEVLCCDTRGEMIIGYPYPDEESNTGFSAESDDVFMIDCAAWMPLPKSYRAERRTDDSD